MRLKISPQEFCETVIKVQLLPGIPLDVGRRQLNVPGAEPRWPATACGQRRFIVESTEDEESRMMKLKELMATLTVLHQRHGDIDVLLSVGEEATDELVHGDVTKVEVEESHDKEELFVRISGGAA